MENLKNIIMNHLPGGVVLMDLTYNSSSDFVRVTIDSSRNISIKETSTIAKRIKNDDNILSMFPFGCKLEVTTPGVGTKLEKKFQYEKNIGRKLILKYYKNNSYLISDTFALVDVKEEGIIVAKDKMEYFIVFESIESAKIKVSFD